MKSERSEIQRRREQLRKQLREICDAPLMRGSIVERRRRCGKPNCACARDADALHAGKFLTVHLDGRTQATHVRPQDEAHIREAIDAYLKLWDIINGLTACELADLRRQASDRRRSKQRRRG